MRMRACRFWRVPVLGVLENQTDTIPVASSSMLTHPYIYRPQKSRKEERTSPGLGADYMPVATMAALWLPEKGLVPDGSRTRTQVLKERISTVLLAS